MNLRRNFTSEAQLKDSLDFIYEQSEKGKSFHSIIEVAINDVTIVTAIHNVKSNKGANTPKVDKNKMDAYLKMGRNELIKLVKRTVKDYRSKPVNVMCNAVKDRASCTDVYRMMHWWKYDKIKLNERLRELCAKTRALKAPSTQQKHRCFCV